MRALAWQPRPTSAVVALAVAGAVAGCASNGSGGTGALTVVFETGSPLADAPSDFTVLVVEDGWFGEEVFVREPARTVVAPGLVVLDQQLPVGSYEVTAAQLPCAMNGGECPEDSGPSDYDVPVWQCLTSVTVREEAPTTVIASQNLDSVLSDQGTCTSAGSD